MTNKRILQTVYCFLGMQFVIIASLAIGVFFSLGSLASLSFIYGGLATILPNAYFAMKLFRHSGARNARKIVNGFYHGEVMKLLLSVCLFVLVFKVFTVKPEFFFAGLLLSQLLFWGAPLFLKNKK